jgi:hypothetical protein
MDASQPSIRDNLSKVGRTIPFLPCDSRRITLNQAMNPETEMENKWKKALFSAALGILCSGSFASFVYTLTGHSLYLAIIGLGAGMGFALGGGLGAQ